ncbi:Limb region 1 protein-like protein [Schistosoma japonicum]|uniref:Limb region 1 protein-like protein n=1 Tax=Schistosoma japonicum TaxID=6182 RepID=A0A4Z2DXE8_SCHJA|nr:Limb region 1 protein-like protein [Schistosoma japonicum]
MRNTDDYMDQTDELVLISHEAKEFYDEIRGLVVVFLLFTILFFIAHITLQYFLSKTGYELKACRAERLAYQLVLVVEQGINSRLDTFD